MRHVRARASGFAYPLARAWLRDRLLVPDGLRCGNCAGGARPFLRSVRERGRTWPVRFAAADATHASDNIARVAARDAPRDELVAGVLSDGARSTTVAEGEGEPRGSRHEVTGGEAQKSRS